MINPTCFWICVHVNVQDIEQSSSKSKKTEKKRHKSKEKEDDPVKKEKEKSKKSKKMRYEYFDAGNHWCKWCNLILSNAYELFQHLHSSMHQQVILTAYF